MTAIAFLKWDRDNMFAGHSQEGSRVGPASNAELRRWLTKGSVLINGCRPKPGGEVHWPIWQLIYFPGTQSQCTVTDDYWDLRETWAMLYTPIRKLQEKLQKGRMQRHG